MVKEKSKLEKLASAGVGIVSEVVGAGAGAFAEQHSPGSGAIVKAALTSAMNSGFKNIGGLLSVRQENRAYRAISFADAEIEKNESEGLRSRTDSFTVVNLGETHSDAVEFFEGALRSAMDAYEEKKVPFIGTLMGTVPFSEELSVATAHQLVKIAKDISYRSFVILSVIGQTPIGRFSKRAHHDDGRNGKVDASKHYGFMVECFGLHSAGLIWMKWSPNDENLTMWPGPGDVDPAFLELTPLGSQFFSALGLKSIDANDQLYQLTKGALEEISLTPFQGNTLDSGSFIGKR